VGKALLAFQPDAVLDAVCRQRLTRHTPNTITSPKRLRAELARVRASGFAIDNMEHELGVRCVAAPIRNHTGVVIASLSVSGPAARIREADIPRRGTREGSGREALQPAGLFGAQRKELTCTDSSMESFPR